MTRRAATRRGEIFVLYEKLLRARFYTSLTSVASLRQ